MKKRHKTLRQSTPFDSIEMNKKNDNLIQSICLMLFAIDAKHDYPKISDWIRPDKYFLLDVKKHLTDYLDHLGVTNTSLQYLTPEICEILDHHMWNDLLAIKWAGKSQYDFSQYSPGYDVLQRLCDMFPSSQRTNVPTDLQNPSKSELSEKVWNMIVDTSPDVDSIIAKTIRPTSILGQYLILDCPNSFLPQLLSKWKLEDLECIVYDEDITEQYSINRIHWTGSAILFIK